MVPVRMNAHLALIAQTVLPHNHAAVVVDGAGFHAQANDLVVPANMTLVTLPAHSPELNPAEGVWGFLKNGDLRACLAEFLLRRRPPMKITAFKRASHDFG
jgi:transposase